MFEIGSTDNAAGEGLYADIRPPEDGKNLTCIKMTDYSSVLKGMSHEVRTHMNSIVALSLLMKDKYFSESDRDECSNQILNTCEELIELFESYLESAIIDTGNLKTDNINCNLNTILDDLLTEFREMMRSEDYKEIELVTEIRFSESTDIFIDKGRIYRIMRCLFQNSIKNTSSGYIKIGYYRRENNITFYILDSGYSYLKSKEFLYTDDLNGSLSRYSDTHSAVNITLARKLIQIIGGAVRIECNGLTGSGIYFTVPARVEIRDEININKYVNTVIAI